MKTRLAVLTAAAIALASPVFAANVPVGEPIPTNVAECNQLLDLTSKTATAQADQGPKTRDEVTTLIGLLKQQCEASNFDDAVLTAQLIRGIVASE
ncbi:MAG: hypothetical protein VX871_09020 [Pseudomonadota bacterium]|nr:hypothetical protein [Pseudomonadota bacterium]